jgi:hypothetical protein
MQSTELLRTIDIINGDKPNFKRQEMLDCCQGPLCCPEDHNNGTIIDQAINYHKMSYIIIYITACRSELFH